MTNSEPTLQLTDSAAFKIAELLEEEQNFNLKLRVFLQGGGCSGYTHHFAFIETQNANDWVFDKTVTLNNQEVEVALVCDPASFQRLSGAEIDYVEDLSGARFVIRNNHHAKTTCGCGSSFSTE